MSAIYYVNSPATSTTHAVTVQLTNPAPLVFHIFAVSASDITGPPIVSAITDPGAGGTSAHVTTAPITVPTDSLLLSWVKNETNATATALNSYTLDTQSTSFLWAESQTPISSGSYTGDFQYNTAIGWQTAIVGVKRPSTGLPTPVITAKPNNPTNQSSASFGFTDTVTGVSFLCQLDGSAFAACSSPATYSGLNEGGHTFSVKAQDSSANQSTAATFTWNVDLTAPLTPSIDTTPANPTNQTSATFSFSDTPTAVSFLCQLDGSGFSSCSSPKTYSNLNQGDHTFFVTAQDAAGNQSGAASFTWTIVSTAPPTPAITSAPTNPTNQTSASFGFSDSQAGVTFLCQLDATTFSSCSSPQVYSGLAPGGHTFSVKAQNTAGNQSSPASLSWTIDTTVPPQPVITTAPTSPTNQTSATFSFTDPETGVGLLCRIDNNAFATCSSPTTYSNLGQGTHTFSVKAQDAAGNQSSPASFSWTIDTTAPPKPVITSAPSNPTTQTSATFSFTDSQAGVTFLCELDNGAFVGCSSPVSYLSLSRGKHSFSVRAKDAAGNVSGVVNYKWTIK
jgi:hypothetical protein